MKQICAILLITLFWLHGYSQVSEVKDVTPPGFSGDFESIVYGKGNGFIALGDNNYMYTSYDTCKTWNVKPSPAKDAKEIVMHEDGLTGYMYSTFEMYKTIDGGKTWFFDSTEGIPEVLNDRDMEYRNLFIKNSDTLFFVTSNRENGLRIYMSSDRGETWSMQAERLYGTSVVNVISSLRFVSPLHGYAFADAYYAETQDGGLTWQKHIMNNHETYFYVSAQVDENTIIQSYSTPSESMPDLEGVIWYRQGIDVFKNINGKIMGIWDDNLHITEDTAQTWQLTSLGNYYNDICFINDTVGVLVGKNLTSYITTDAGETWTKYVHGAAEGMEQIYCKNTEECFITGSKGRLFRTQDGGDTWTWEDIHTNILHEIEFPTQDTGYIVGDKVLFMTIDGGETWNKKVTDKTNSSLIEFTTSNSGYLGYDGTKSTIEKTIDAGDTWTDPIDANYFYNSKYNRKFSFRDINEGVVCGSDNLLLHTDDGGTNWHIIDSIPSNYTYMYNIVSVSDRGWLVQAIEYSVTTDMFYCDNEFNCQIVFPGNGQGFVNLQQINDSTYAISHDTLEYISTDYGLTWNELEVMIPGKIDFVDVHHAFSMSSYNISKAYWGLQDISLSITQNNSRNYSLSPVFTDNSIHVTVYVRDSENTLHEVAQDITLQNGVEYTLEIPQEIPSGRYSIYIEPHSSAYAPVESEVFDIGTGIQAPEHSRNNCFSQHGNTLHIQDKHAKIYTIPGIEIPITNTDIQLNAGVYIIKTKCGTEKIMVNPLVNGHSD